MNPSCADRIVKSSIQRLKHDCENGFEFLRKVPSTYSRIFASYWTEKAGPDALTEYLDSIPHPIRLGRDKVRVTSKGLAEYADNAVRRWEFRSVPMKQTLGMIFLRRGRLAEYQRTGATDTDLRRYGALKWRWPSERQVVKAFSKEFEMQFLHREGGAEYQISAKHGANSCATRLLINVRLKLISYFHFLNDCMGHFVLIDHAGDWGTTSWNLVTEENLDAAVCMLRKIVDDFESSLD